MIKDLWREKMIKSKDALDQLVIRSRWIGSDPKLCLWGGGNTSTKTTEKSPFGGEVKVLWVKGSGSDMKVCERKHFTPLDLQKLLSLLSIKEMSDETMVDYIARAQLSPKAPRSSIEALLHAFIPYSDIDHSHADAVLSITNNSKNKQLFKKLYGDEMLWIPYVKPGFELSKRVYAAFQKNKMAKGAILEKHGVITWGNSSKQSYSRMIEMVGRAENFIQKQAKGKTKTIFGGKRFRELKPNDRGKVLSRFLPVIRSAVSKNKRMILTVNSAPSVLEFVNSKKGAELSQIGCATPDHMLRTKGKPLFLKVKTDVNHLTEKNITAQIESYAKAHARYFKQFKSSGMQMLDPYPRVILIPQIGLVATGKDLAAAKECSEIYEHSIAAIRGGEVTGKYKSLPISKIFEMEYWPLELYKLSLAPPEASLARKIAVVTGAVGAIGRSISEKLAREGAHVALTDLDLAKAQKTADEINSQIKSKRVVGLKLDVTSEGSVREALRKVVMHFGGLDLVVSNAGIAHISSMDQLSLSDWEKSLKVNATGHFLIAREAVRIFKQQKLGGNLVFIATKNVMAPGKDFGAYSASKSAEAQLAKIIAIEGGEFNIRVNLVNPDGIFENSGLWNQKVRAERAKSYGISVNKLEDFYKNRNLMKTRILPEDVANSVSFLASDMSAKTTGCTITVDGGVKEAFPR